MTIGDVLRFYTLRHRKPVRCDDMAAWSLWMSGRSNIQHRVIRSTYLEGKWISTVFLGLDHSLSLSGGPLLFETMIFKLEVNGSLYQTRCSTHRQALKMHRNAVMLTKSWLAGDTEKGSI